MRYTEPLSNQVLMFISSIGPGVIIGLLYDLIFSFFSKLGKNTATTIVGDVLFSLIATMISFFYMVVYNNGTVRLNIIVAQIIGAVAFHITMGKYVAKIVGFAAMLIGKVIAILSSPLTFVLRKIRQVSSNININIKKLTLKRKNSTENKEAT